ncbi:hypothetical protein [Burkholderia cenocepacia]|uniref:Uncharacterized protein n=1 Tax=Burkholderia cenocepacia TaxID=95486 RepID=A0A6B2MP27_9BURK|nr:hypothetical protein [Burkholderia cenocepacia]NDV77234.1 hypothetical protein [Burkholderia cenocepacia]
MIDISKMKALAATLRTYTGVGCVVDDANAAADAIDSLLSELEAREADRLDAKKYRWMRRELHAQGCLGVYCDGWLNEQTLDEKCDAALAQQQEGEDHDQPPH